MTDAAELPVGWVRVRLDEIAEVRLGRQRSPQNHSGDQMRPYLRAANVTWAGLNLTDVKEMNFTDEEVTVYQVLPGDILLSEASGSADEVGKPALWRGERPGPMCFQNTLLRVRPATGVLPEYLHRRLFFECIRGGFARASRGVGIHHLGAAKMSALPVELPPGEEQQRICDVLDAQLSLYDKTLEGLRKIAGSVTVTPDSQLGRLRTSLLAAAFQGRLTSQDPSDVPADVLVKQISEERAAAGSRTRGPRAGTGGGQRRRRAAARVEESA